MKKRMLALLLAVALVFSTLPVSVFAEETVIEETIPEVTEPLETEPEVTEPEVTEPEETEPEETEPQVTEPEVTEPEVTEPEVTEPEVTEPEVTEPDAGIAPMDETSTQEEATAGVIASGTVGEGVNWVLTEDGVLTISGTGAIPDYTNVTHPVWFEKYRTNVTKLVIEDGITRVGNYAFEFMSCITSVELSSSTLTEIGDYGFANCDKLTSVNIPDGVTSIGNSAFRYCRGLTSFTFSDSVTTIGQSALAFCYNLTTVTLPKNITSLSFHLFRDCTKLKSFTIPNHVTSIGAQAFYNCTGLTSIEIPDSVTLIGNQAFYGCTGLTSVVIPDSVTSIGVSAFSGCNSLTSIEIPDSVSVINDSAFYNCHSLRSVHITDLEAWLKITFTSEYSHPLASVYDGYLYLNGTPITDLVIPDGTITIAKRAFYNCRTITSVTFPDSVTDIGLSAFSKCTGLTSVTIPGGVTSIGDSAFSGCTGLTSVTIPDNVTSIGASAFSGCTGLTSVTIPDSVTSIGASAFSGCTRLPSVTIPDSVTSIGLSAFSGCTKLTSVNILDGVTSIEDSAFSGCTALSSITIPDSVTSIGTRAFANCTGLTSITIPGSVASVGNYAFSGCTALSSITILDGVTSIGDYVFSGCTGLTSVTLPDSVTSIGAYTFENCTGLTSVNIPEEATSIGFAAFIGCTGLTQITVPEKVATLGSYAFKNCTALEEVTLGSAVTSIGDSAFEGCTALTQIDADHCALTSVGANAFYGCTALTKVLLPDTVTSIGDNAFYDCQMVAEFTLPSGLTSLGDSAFYNCYSLGSAVIPEGITAIEDNTFYSCYSLTSVSLPETLTTIGKNAFYQCFYLYDINLPDAVTSIGNAAFYDCESLPSVKLPARLTSIGTDAFYFCISMLEVSIPQGVTKLYNQTFAGCNNLISVTIPASVTSINQDAFAGCHELRHVLFTGTEAQWNKITLAEGNELLNSATRHFGASGDEVTVSWDENGRQGYCTICDAPLDLSTMSIEGCLIYMVTDHEYTGAYIRPEVALLSTAYGYLEEGTDFTVSYKNNKNVGFATATVTGIGDFAGTMDLEFYIYPQQVKNLQVKTTTTSSVTLTFSSVPQADFYLVYRGTSLAGQTSETTFTDSNLVSNRTFEYTVRACTEVGEYYFSSNPSETVTARTCTNISGYTMSLDYTSTIYDGTEKQPAVTVINTKGNTFSTSNYTVTYEDNILPGLATVTVTGKGAYTGTLTKTFKIMPQQVTGVEVVSSVGSSITIAFDPVPGATEYWIYQGSTRKAKIEDTTYTFTGLTIGTTYNFSVKANTNVNGVDYTGAASQTVSARPSSSIESYTLTLSGVPKAYTGTALKPTVKVVTDTGTTLSYVYYTVTCTENVDVGTATVTVTGKGKYSGTLTATYDIVPPKAAAPTVKVVDGVSVQVSWKAVKQAQWYEVFVDGVLHGRTSELTYVADGLTPGKSHKFTLRAGATIDGKDYIGALSSYTSATPRHSMSSCTLELAENEFVYSGRYIKPVPTVYGYQGEVLTQGVDYTLSYVDSKNTGRATVKVTGKGAYTGTASEYYYIYPAQVTGLKISSSTTSSVKVSWTKASTYSTKYYNVYVNGELAGRTTYGYYNIKGLTLGEIYSVYVVPEKTLASGTYYGAASETIEVWPGTYLGSYKVTLAYTKGVYEGAPLCPSVVVKSSTKASAVTLVQGVDYTVEYVNNDAPGTASVIIRGINAYVGTITKTFTVRPAQVTGLEITQVTHNSVTVCFDPVPGATEYWVYQGTTRKARITDTSYTFTGLSAGTTYKFSVKANGISGGKNYTGTASASVSAKPVYRLEEGSVTVKYDTKVYTGYKITNTFTVKGIDGTTISSSYYTAAYENNVEMGTATVTITGKGKCIGQLQTTFNIGPKAVTGVKVTLLDGTSAKVTYSALSGISRYNIYVNGELAASTQGTEYVLTGLTPGIKNSITVRGVIYDEHGNTITGVASSAVTVTPRHSMSICTLELAETDLVYNGSNQIPPFTVYGYEGAVLTQGVDYTVSLVDPKNTGRATIKITGKGAYTGSISQYYYIYPAQVTGLKVVSTAATSVKVSWTKSSTYSAKYYNVYVNGEKVGRTSYGYYTITGLTPGEIYSVYVIGEKTLASGTYYGAPSQTLEVRPA